LETVFTSDIIEKHDERMTGTHRTSSEFNSLNNSAQPEVIDEKAMSSKRIEEAEVDCFSGSDDTLGSRGELEDDIEDSESSEVQSIDEIENNSESQYEHMLKDAGKQLRSLWVSRVT